MQHVHDFSVAAVHGPCYAPTEDDRRDVDCATDHATLLHQVPLSRFRQPPAWAVRPETQDPDQATHHGISLPSLDAGPTVNIDSET